MITLIAILVLILILLGLWKYYGLELIRISGDSMFPTYKDRDIVLIRKNRLKSTDLAEGKVFVYYNPTGYLVIKRLQEVKFFCGYCYLWFEGDNTENSEDSRAYGYVCVENLEGVVVFSKKNKNK